MQYVSCVSGKHNYSIITKYSSSILVYPVDKIIHDNISVCSLNIQTVKIHSDIIFEPLPFRYRKHIYKLGHFNEQINARLFYLPPCIIDTIYINENVVYVTKFLTQ